MRVSIREVSGLDDVIAWQDERGARSLIFDVEPLVALWDTSERTLRDGVETVLARLAGVDGVGRFVSPRTQPDTYSSARTRGVAERMADRLAQVKQEYRDRLSRARHQGGGRQPRRGSTVLRLLDSVSAHPIDTASTAADRLGVSTVAAREALEELASADIYRKFKIDKGKTVSYLAHEILALADSSFGEGLSAGMGPDPPPVPERPVPTRGQRTGPSAKCGYPLPRAGGWCTLTAGHTGRHRRAAQPGSPGAEGDSGSSS